MADFSHRMARIAFSKAIDVMLNRIYKDRQKGMLQLVDIVEKYVGNMFAAESYERIRALMTDPNEKWNQYVNRLIDELDPNVLKMTLLNLGFLDGGFYLAAGAEPENRYFCTLNMDLPAMQEEHDRLIREGGADFLVVRSRNAAYPGYTTVDTASFPFEGREWTYHLLQYTGTDETPSDQTEQHRDRRY